MTKLLEPLLQSPVFPDLVRQAQEVLEREEEARDRFLKKLTPEMKAEFVLGETIMHSPAKARHLRVTRNLFVPLHNHVAETPGSGEVFVEKCLVSLTRNDFEPDIVWFSAEKAAAFTDDQMRFPAPDFVVEVLSQSTEERDRGIKMEDYALHGVREYWIVDADAKTVEKYLLEAGAEAFELAEKLTDGSVGSAAIEGFRIGLNDLFR